MRKFLKLFTAILSSLFLIPLIIVCNQIIQQNIFKKDYPTLFGYGSSTVLTGSMDPKIKPGDLVITHQEETYSIGDIITFEQDGALVTHRIININNDYYYTQGDANDSPDSQVLTYEDIKGKVVFTIKGLGHISLFLKSREGFIFVLAIFAIVMELSYFPFDDEDVNLTNLYRDKYLTPDLIKLMLFFKNDKITEEHNNFTNFIIDLIQADYNKAGIRKLDKESESFFPPSLYENIKKSLKKIDFVDEIYTFATNQIKTNIISLDGDENKADQFIVELNTYKYNIVNNLLDIVLTNSEKRKLFRKHQLIANARGKKVKVNAK